MHIEPAPGGARCRLACNRARSTIPVMSSRVAGATIALASGPLVIYLAFNAGGYFPDTQGLVAVGLLIAIAFWIAFAEEPFAGVTPLLAVAAAALAAFAVWALMSGGWSNSNARALLEFDRALLYLAALVLFGLAVREERQVQWFLWSVGGAITFVCVVGLITRVLPEVWPIERNIANERLAYPITYWNALGLLGSLGIIFGLHTTTRAQGATVPRVLGAAAIPLLATTVYFTFSRGAILAGAIGIVAYLALARPRGIASGLMATVPASAIALVAAYDADLLATARPTTKAAIEQGQDLLPILIACALGAAAIRAVLILLDRRVARMRPIRPPALVAGTVVGLVVAAIVALAVGAPGYVDRQYERFKGEAPIETGGDLRQRLTQAGPNGRLDYWELALDEFGREEAQGRGAGTFQLAWERERPYLGEVTDAHGLYQELMGELGLVGLLLLATALGVILFGFARRMRGPSQPLYAALLAAGIVWAIRAALDWDWEMPVVTIWLFAAGGMALTSPAGERSGLALRPPPIVRVAVAVPVILLAALPFSIMSSQAWLERSHEAFARADCEEATSDARSSIRAISSRPEPYEVLGYCAVRAGNPGRGAREMREAIDRDPDNWEYRYGLGLALAIAGRDPRPVLREAHRLNPLGILTFDVEERFGSDNPRVWRSEASYVVRRLVKL
jgi:O-antigen ligase